MIKNESSRGREEINYSVRKNYFIPFTSSEAPEALAKSHRHNVLFNAKEHRSRPFPRFSDLSRIYNCFRGPRDLRNDHTRRATIDYRYGACSSSNWKIQTSPARNWIVPNTICHGQWFRRDFRGRGETVNKRFLMSIRRGNTRELVKDRLGKSVKEIVTLCTWLERSGTDHGTSSCFVLYDIIILPRNFYESLVLEESQPRYPRCLIYIAFSE